MTVIRPTQPIPPPPDMSAEDLDKLATSGLGPRFRLVMAAIKNVFCPTCKRPGGERCTGNKTHNDRVWLYAARLRREKNPRIPETIAAIREGLDKGLSGFQEHAIAMGLLRLATGPDGCPHWVRTKALEDAGQPVDEVKSALLSAGMVDGIRVSSIDSPDIVQIEAGTGRRILLTVDGMRIQAAEVHVHRHLPAEEATDTPCIHEIAALRYVSATPFRLPSDASMDAARARVEALGMHWPKTLPVERLRPGADGVSAQGFRPGAAEVENATNADTIRRLTEERDRWKAIGEAALQVAEERAAKTRASIVAFVEAAAQHFQQQLDEDPLIPEGLIGEGFILRSERRVRLQAKASELRTIAAYIARGDDEKGGGMAPTTCNTCDGKRRVQTLDADGIGFVSTACPSCKGAQ